MFARGMSESTLDVYTLLLSLTLNLSGPSFLEHLDHMPTVD